jgi:hypothetical protein
MQSNLKLTSFKQLKTAGSDIFGLKSDTSGLGRICLILGWIVWSAETLSSKKVDRETRRCV